MGLMEFLKRILTSNDSSCRYCGKQNSCKPDGHECMCEECEYAEMADGTLWDVDED